MGYFLPIQRPRLSEEHEGHLHMNIPHSFSTEPNHRPYLLEEKFSIPADTPYPITGNDEWMNHVSEIHTLTMAHVGQKSSKQLQETPLAQIQELSYLASSQSEGRLLLHYMP